MAVMVIMMMMVMRCAIILLSVGGAHALPWDGAKPTNDLNLPLRYQEAPKPTAVPALRARQAPGDVTCAWENGGVSSQYLLYCASQYLCATNSLGAFGCCSSLDIDNCALRTTCIDSSALPDYSSSYGIDNYALSCTNAQLPYCIAEVIELDRSVTGWACDSTSIGRTELYYSTYWNASAASTVTIPTYYNAVYLSYTTPSLRTSTSSSTSTSTSSTPSTTSISTSSSMSPTPTPASDSSSPTPVGAIVGGSVGGAAVIAGAALIAYYLVRRSKQQDNSQSPYTGSQPPMQQPQSPPPQSPPPQSPPLQNQYIPYPGQPGYVHGGQYPAQPAYYPEKAPGENTAPVHASSDMGSPTLTSPDRTSTVPSYVQRHELG